MSDQKEGGEQLNHIWHFHMFSLLFSENISSHACTHAMYNNIPKNYKLVALETLRLAFCQLVNTMGLSTRVRVSVCVCLLDTAVELWVCSLHVQCCRSVVSLPRH